MTKLGGFVGLESDLLRPMLTGIFESASQPCAALGAEKDDEDVYRLHALT
jgi:hypothetical protein